MPEFSIRVAHAENAPSALWRLAVRIAEALGRPNPDDEPAAIAREAMGIRARIQARDMLLRAAGQTLNNDSIREILTLLVRVLRAHPDDDEEVAALWDHIAAIASDEGERHWDSVEEEA